MTTSLQLVTNRFIVAGASGLFFGLLGCSSLYSQSFDISQGFSTSSNPAGAWRWGAVAAFGGPLTLDTYEKNFASDNGVDISDWQLSASQGPAFARVMGAGVAQSDGNHFTAPSGTVYFTPPEVESSQNYALFRFTVPAGGAGDYLVQCSVHSQYDFSRSQDADFHVVKNGVELFGQNLAPNSGTGYTNTFALAVGDTVDFAIGRGPDGVTLDTGLKIQAVLTFLPHTPPLIVSQPGNQTVSAGASASFSIQATGSSPLAYQWHLNGVDLPDATNATLTLSHPGAADAGLYSVDIFNAYGQASSSNALLTVIPLSQSYDLSRDFSTLSNPNGVWSYGSEDSIGGAFSQLTFPFAQPAENGVTVESWQWGRYQQPAVFCNATTNTATTDDGQGVFPPGTVWCSAAEDGRPMSFGVVRFTVPAGGAGQYRLETAARSIFDTALSGDGDYHVALNGGEIFGRFLPPSSSTGYTNALLLAAGERLDFLIGRGADGIEYASGLKLQVRLDLLSPGDAIAPIILVQPQDRTVTTGGNVTFSVIANGTAPLTYQWSREGTDLPGADGPTLALNNVQPAQAGHYAVRVTNPQSSLGSSNVLLVVEPLPVVTNVNLIANGSFELNAFVQNSPTVPDSFLDGASSLQNWTAGGLTPTLQPDLYRAGTYYNTPSGATNPTDQYLIGFYGPHGDFVEQAFPTVAGTPYSVSFQQSHGGVYDLGAQGWTSTSTFGGLECRVTGNNLLLDQVFTPSGPAIPFEAIPPVPNGTAGSWETKAFIFIADSAATTLRFAGTGNGVEFLDQVVVRALSIPNRPSFDISHDFSTTSNPAGAWSWGTVAAFGGPFSLVTFEKNFASDNGVAISDWQLSGSQGPAFARVMGAGVAQSDGNHFTASSGTVYFTPPEVGSSQNYALFRFTVRTNGSGNYLVQCSVHSQYDFSRSQDADFHIVKNGVELFGQNLAPNSGTGYTNTLSLAAGDTVDFAIGRGPDGITLDTGLKIQATLTPGGPTQPPPLPNLLVVPSQYRAVEGGGGAGELFEPFRLQQVYGSQLFPTGPVLLRDVRWRPSAVYGKAFTADITNLQINLSTTTRQPGELSQTFSENPGADETVVFQGPITLSSAFTGAPGGPKDFDIFVPLTTPFLYDPAAGNLLFEVRNFGSIGTYVDEVAAGADGISRMFAPGPDSTSGLGDAGGDVMAFGYSSISTAPSFISQPQSRVVTAGAAVSFTAAVAGTPPFSYQWLLDGVTLPGDTAPALTLNNVQLAQAGSYSVIVANAFGSATSEPAVLTVFPAPPGPPSIVSISPSQTVNDGANVALVVVASGSAPFSYQWQSSTGDLPGAANATLSFTPAHVADSGNYVVRVSNGGGSITSPPVSLTVVSTTVPPSVTAQPGSRVVATGSPTTFTVGVAGSPPLSYQWFFNGTALAGATDSSFSIASVQVAQLGTYWVMMSNPYGSASSAGAVLNFNDQGGGQLSFSLPALTYVFDVDGSNRVAAGTAFLAQLYAGPTADSLQAVGAAAPFTVPGRFAAGGRIVPTVDAGSVASVQVRVWESAYGSSYEAAKAAGGKTGVSIILPLTLGGYVPGGGGAPPMVPPNLQGMQSFSLVPGQVLTPPQITGQPVGQSVLLGDSASLSVTASGPGVLHYQWYLGANAVAGGDAATLTLSNIATSQGGDYTVVANNSGGAVTSEVATVSVEVDRVLLVVSPADQNGGGLASVPVQLSSLGDVGGMTFVLHYDPDYLSTPDVTWDSSLDGALVQANVPLPGQVRFVFALSGVALPAGTQTLATVNFRARVALADTTVALTPEVVDVSSAAGNSIPFGTAVEAGSVVVLAGNGTLGDDNGNGRLDIGDATLLLRLLAQLDTVRSWDLGLNDLNQNGLLDSGDVIKLLRVVAGIDPQPGGGSPGVVAQPSPLIPLPSDGRGASPAAASPAAQARFSASPASGQAVLSPATLKGTSGQLVTVQVVLQNVSSSIAGASFTLHYPVTALRLLDAKSLRTGSLVPAGAVALWNVSPSQNNFITQNGQVALAVTSKSPWANNAGVLAELVFQVQSGAASQYAWPVTLSGVEVSGNGFDNSALGTAPLMFIGREAVAGSLGAASHNGAGQFQFSLSGDAGASYVIEASTNLITWGPFTNVVNSTGVIQVVDPASSGSGHRFFRARPLP